MKAVPESKKAKGTRKRSRRRVNKRRNNAKSNINSDVISDNVKTDQIIQALDGVRLLQKQQKKTQNLLDDDDEDIAYYLQVTTFKVPNLLSTANHVVRANKIKVFLPNPLVNSNTDVLLVTKDDEEGKDIRNDHTENLARYQDLLRRTGAAQHISQVMTLKQLKTEYKEYEAKRNLASQSDIVLVDDTIIRRIPIFLGKPFYNTGKIPVGVNLKSPNLKSEVERCLTLEYLNMPNKGNCGLMKIGRGEQTNEQIVENVRAAIEKMKAKLPGGWENVKRLNLKTNLGTAVPFYIGRLDAINNINIKPRPLNDREEVTGKLSTMGGKSYTILPSNDVVLTASNEIRKAKRGKNSEPDSDGPAVKKRRRGKKAAKKNGKEEETPEETNTPEKTKEDETPKETVEDKTPKKTVEDKTPKKAVEDKTPKKTVEDETPMETEEVKTPKKTEKGKTPKKTEKGKTPKKIEEGKTPKKIEEGKTPKKTEKGKTPKKIEEGKAPKKTVEGKTPKKTVEDKTPKKTVEDKTPKKTEKGKTPKKTKEEKTPKKTEKGKTPKKTKENKTPKKETAYDSDEDDGKLMEIERSFLKNLGREDKDQQEEVDDDWSEGSDDGMSDEDEEF